MTTEAQGAALPEVARPSKLARALRGIGTFMRKNPLGGIGAVMVISVLIMAAGVEVFQRYDPLYQDYLDRLLPPGPAHFMGTDEFGRDLWARVVGGSRISVIVGSGI